MPSRSFPRIGRPLALAVLAASIGSGISGCRGSDEPLGPADSFKVFVPKADRASAGGKAPLVEEIKVDEPRFLALQKLFDAGFGPEMMRTTYLAKQFFRDADAGGKGVSPAARKAALEPTAIIIGGTAPGGIGLALPAALLGGPTEKPDLPWIALPDGFDRDKALVQTVTGLLARQIGTAVAAGGALSAASWPGGQPAPLVEGYARAMEVIAREWRTSEGQGPAGMLPRDAGTPAQIALFNVVRENAAVKQPGSDRLKSPAEMLADPDVAATVIYRMAQARTIGHRVGPADFYKPFTTDRIPQGVSPAAVLGPFRNFQAKLLGVWGKAVLAGKPPRTIVDLVEAYVAAFPAEKAEAIRIFLVTTYAATAKPGGVSAAAADADKVLPELVTLSAAVAAGKRPLVAPPEAAAPAGAAAGPSAPAPDGASPATSPAMPPGAAPARSGARPSDRGVK